MIGFVDWEVKEIIEARYLLTLSILLHLFHLSVDFTIFENIFISQLKILASLNNGYLVKIKNKTPNMPNSDICSK